MGHKWCSKPAPVCPHCTDEGVPKSDQLTECQSPAGNNSVHCHFAGWSNVEHPLISFFFSGEHSGKAWPCSQCGSTWPHRAVWKPRCRGSKSFSQSATRWLLVYGMDASIRDSDTIRYMATVNAVQANIAGVSWSPSGVLRHRKPIADKQAMLEEIALY